MATMKETANAMGLAREAGAEPCRAGSENQTHAYPPAHGAGSVKREPDFGSERFAAKEGWEPKVKAMRRLM